jgi:hypothetical protein
MRNAVSNGYQMVKKAQETFGKEEKMRAETKAATHKFLDQFNDLSEVKLRKNSDIEAQIEGLALFVAQSRCPVTRDRYTKTIDYTPQPEGPPRVFKQLQQLAVGIALVQGKNRIDAEVYEVIKKVAADQLPVSRLKAIEYLWFEEIIQYAGAWRKTREIAQSINMPTQTTDYILGDLTALGVTNRTSETEKKTSPNLWQLTDDFSSIIGLTEILK